MLSINNQSCDLKSQYRLFTVEGSEEDATCSISIVKQRNSFPCPSGKFRRNNSIRPIFNKTNLTQGATKKSKK